MREIVIFTVVMMSVLTINSCTKEGCTDPDAVNYDTKAQADDGNCIIAGCTDKDAANYNPRASQNDGNCTYNRLLTIYSQVQYYGTYDADNYAYMNVYLNGTLAGEIADQCMQDTITCHTQCSKLTLNGISQGVHNISYLVLKSNSTPSPDTLKHGDTVQVSLKANSCKTIVLQ